MASQRVAVTSEKPPASQVSSVALQPLVDAMVATFLNPLGKDDAILRDFVRLLLGAEEGMRRSPRKLVVDLTDLARRMGSVEVPDELRAQWRSAIPCLDLLDFSPSDCPGLDLHSCGRPFLDFLQKCSAQLGAVVRDDAMAVAEQVLQPENFLKTGVLVPNPREQTFEEWTGALSLHLHHVAERQYRPILQLGLRFTRLIRAETKPIPNELGSVMGQCRDLWNASGGPSAVLDERIRAVRNSEAHAALDTKDVRASTVSFVNVKPDGTKEVGATMTVPDFVTFAFDVRHRCDAMIAALRSL